MRSSRQEDQFYYVSSPSCFQSKWQKEVIPQDPMEASIVHLKVKQAIVRQSRRDSSDGHRSQDPCQNPLQPMATSQRLGCETANMVPFAARQLQEKCQEQYRNFDITFVDLKNAFDTVNCWGVWKIVATLAVQISSTVLCFISTMTCLLEYWTKETPQKHFQSLTDSSKAVFLPPHC